MGDLVEIYPPEKQLRYAVYSVRNVTPDGLLFNRSFIVLKNGYGVIVRFTRLHEYSGAYDKRTTIPLESNPEGKMYFIVMMLNYVLVDHGDEFGVRHVFDITKDMLASFFNDYGLEPMSDGSHRCAERVERCISVVTAFMASLASNRKYAGYMKIKKKDLYEEKLIYTKGGKPVKKLIPDFKATVINDEKVIFRDIPTKAVEILIPMAFRYAPDIAFALCLQAFAGLRASEAMNVRQEGSPYGPGITFTEIGGQVTEAAIDLRRELALRSDGAEVGLIKRTRIQRVYPEFIATFCEAYRLHKQYLAGVSFEEDYAPMFVNRDGMAMSYESYRQKFKDLVNNHLRPELIKSSDPELRIYGQLLYENDLSTQCLRHWFTVQLVLRNKEIGDIQFWRGDKNPESAFTYMQNKGELTKALKHTNETLTEILIMLGGELYGKL